MNTLTIAHRLLAELDKRGFLRSDLRNTHAMTDDNLDAAGLILRSEPHDIEIDVFGDLDTPPIGVSPARVRFVYQADGSVILSDLITFGLGIHRDWIPSVEQYITPAEYGFPVSRAGFLSLSELGRTDEADLYPGHVVAHGRAADG